MKKQEVESTIDLAKPEMARVIPAIPEVAADAPKVDIEKVPVIEPVNLVILVDHISCGKMENGIFTLQYRKKPCANPLFPLKPKNEHYGYDHHFEMADMARWSTFMKEMFPYGQHNAETQQADHANLTLSSWADLMRHYMYTAIVTGIFNVQKVAKDNTPVNIKVEWRGEPIAYPELKHVAAKTDKPKKISTEDLAGLDFFNE